MITGRKCSLELLNHKEALWHREMKGMVPKHWIQLQLLIKKNGMNSQLDTQLLRGLTPKETASIG